MGMSKKLFILLVVLMSLSLIGIIFVQSFFINNSLENEEKNFTRSVTRALSFVSRDIQDYEIGKFYALIQPYIANNREPDSTAIRQLYITTEDEVNDQTIIHRNTILEERFKVPSLFFEIDTDSIDISNFTSERTTEYFDRSTIDGNQGIKPTKTLVEFAIYDDDLATKVQTRNFNKSNAYFGIPIFLDTNNESSYRLWVDFPDRKKFLLSSILKMIVLSIVFTGVIILAYSSAIYQLIRQRQISQIKTDFINNMTHEFKTPIATINLALDAIKNPKIIADHDKVKRYLGMIKDENKRMHAQVENVLRISKLEKK